MYRKLVIAAAGGMLVTAQASASSECSSGVADLFRQGQQARAENRIDEARSLLEEAASRCSKSSYWQELGDVWFGDQTAGPEGSEQALEFYARAFSAARMEQDDAAGAAAARSIVEVGLLGGDPIKANNWLIVAQQLEPEHPDMVALQGEVDAARAELSTSEIEAGFNRSRGLGRVNQLLAGGVTASAFWDGAEVTEDPTISQLETDPLSAGGGAGDVSIDIPIRFESNSTETTADTAQNIENLARVLADQPDTVTITFIGHADTRGDAAYNLRLSRERAEHILGTVVSLQPTLQGRIQVLGRGAAEPFDPGSSARAHANNRRLEVSLTEQG